MQNNKKHFWLSACQVIYVDGKGTHYERTMNALFKTNAKQVVAHDLGKLQQAAQARFFKETFPEGIPTEIQVRDVVILTVSYLGLMSEAEFQAGMKDDTDKADTAGVIQ